VTGAAFHLVPTLLGYNASNLELIGGRLFHFLTLARLIVAILSVAVSQDGRAATSTGKLYGDFLGFGVMKSEAATEIAVLSYRPERPRKRFLERWQILKGELKAQSVHELWSDVAAYDICRDDQKKDLLVFLRPDGLYAFGEAQPLISMPTLFAHFRDDRLPRLRLCFGDNDEEVAIPTLTGLTIFRRKGTEFVKLRELKSRADMRFFSSPLRGDDADNKLRLNIGLKFPDTHWVDYNGDNIRDVCMSGETEIVCYLGSKEQAQDLTVSTEHRFDVLTPQEEKESNKRVEMILSDVNVDGLLDVIIRVGQFGASDMQAELRVFIRKKSGFAAQPNQVIKRSGYFHFHELRDIDNDGDVDIIAPLVDLSWTSLTGIVITGSTDIEFGLFRNNKGVFNSDPESITEISYPVNFKNFSAIMGCLPLWGGKFIAGKTEQVVFFPDAEAIAIHNIEGGKIADEPVKTLSDVSIGSAVLSLDAEEDGVLEVLIAYPQDLERSRQLTLVKGL
jgi:hypothetical protein